MVSIYLWVFFVFISWLTPGPVSALERDSPERFFAEYERVSRGVERLSDGFQHLGFEIEMGQVLKVLDQLAAARERLARYDAARLAPGNSRFISVEHSRLRALFYAYEAMAQMLSAEIDYQVTGTEALKRLASRYRETWEEAEAEIHRTRTVR